MYQSFLFSRKEITRLIKNHSNIIKKGYYWYPNFNIIFNMKGNLPELFNEYAYPRELFKNKTIFSTKDLIIFNSKKLIEENNLINSIAFNNQFNSENKDILLYTLKDKIPGCEFNLKYYLKNYLEFKIIP